MSEYVELHCHSAFSFLDGASHPQELVSRADELGYHALALTDHDGLYGSMEFARAAREAGVQPITGAELTLVGCFPDEPAPPPVEAWREPPAGDPPPEYHVTVLAETPAGYANLCRLLTRSRMESPRGQPRLPLDALLERTEGLILLTGCRKSPLAAALERGSREAEQMAHRLARAFPSGSTFVELQANSVRGDRVRNRALGALADRLRLPVVATGNVHYHHVGRQPLQDVLVAIRNRTTVDDSHALRRPNACFYLASAREMAARFAGRPDAIASTLKIADRCRAFDLTADMGYRFPDFEGSERTSAIRALAEECQARLEERYPSGRAGSKAARLRAEAEERLARELDLVYAHDLSGFFLVYRDILNLATEVAARVRGGASTPRASLPPGRGRGSSVSSIICYLIGLSHIDPVQNDLYLGRFLNEAMGSVPDIDIDFARDIREELILAVYERYGYDHVGLVCTFPTYRTRSIVREVGKALSLPVGEIEKLAKLAEPHGDAGLQGELERLPEFRDRAGQPLWRLLASLADQIRGLPRHVSQHVGGMVISSRPLNELVPLEPAAWEGRVLCQWDKDSCQDAGFIKIDFLALGMLSLVEEAVELIADRHGDAPDLSRIDFEDEEVYDRICSGDNVGLFQVESRAQIQMVRRVRPRNLADLAVQVAIVRPGPIVGGAVNPYVRRRELQREIPAYRVPYDHPLLEEALSETLGVIIFQDQVLQVCKVLAGFTDGQAEELRRAMSRKRSREAMLSHWQAFRDGAALRGVPTATAQRVFEQVIAFSEFGFPKSHAAAFGLLAYQSAWLRHYYPTEYYVGLFNNQPMGFYALDAIARDARRHGVAVRLPDINRSDVVSTPEWDSGLAALETESDVASEPGALRIGLGFVRDLGREVAEGVVAERERHGPYRSLPDLLRRTPATFKRLTIENLIWVGALDRFGLTRRELLWQAGLWLGPEAETQTEHDRVAEQGGAGAERRPIRRRAANDRADHAQTEIPLEDPALGQRFDDLNVMERLMAEYQIMGFAAELHPLTLVRDRLPGGTMFSSRFPQLPNKREVQVAGLVVARQRPQTAKGFVFILMEDEDGPINVIVRPDLYDRCRSAIRLEPFLLVRGTLQKDGGTVNVLAEFIGRLELSEAAASLGQADRPSGQQSDRVQREAEPLHTGSGSGTALIAARRKTRVLHRLRAFVEQDVGADRDRGVGEDGADPFEYLAALRENAPPALSWGRGGGAR